MRKSQYTISWWRVIMSKVKPKVAGKCEYGGIWC